MSTHTKEPDLPVVSFVNEKRFKKQKKHAKIRRKRRASDVSTSSAEGAQTKPKRQKMVTEEANNEEDFPIETLKDSQQSDSESSDIEDFDKLQKSDSEDSHEESADGPAGDKGFGMAVEHLLAKATSNTTDQQPPVLANTYEAKKKKKHKVKDAAAKAAAKKERELRIQKHLLRNKDHVLPDHESLGFEMKLKKFATKGVVKLFNALKLHKSQIRVDPSQMSQKVENLSRNKFLELLNSKRELSGEDVQRMLGHKEGDAPAPTAKLVKVKKEKTNSKLEGLDAEPVEPKEEQWDVLRDDYLLGARLKDWNKASDEEEDNEGYSSSEGSDVDADVDDDDDDDNDDDDSDD